MGIVHLFSGNALAPVDADGGVSLPPFILGVIERRSEAKAVVLGAHETDPCLAAYDPGFRRNLEAELERRRLRDEAGGEERAHHHRARRAFGLTEDAPFDGSGRIVLPPMMRRRGRIGDLALFVGAGGTFEIWNPHLACEAEDEVLREVAEYRLGEASISKHQPREE